MSAWTKITDGLPGSEEVLLRHGNNHFLVCVARDDDGTPYWFVTDSGRAIEFTSTQSWLPLSALPE